MLGLANEIANEVDSALGVVVHQTRGELIVVGTQGRVGIKGVLIGNTAERILHAVNADVLTARGP